MTTGLDGSPYRGYLYAYPHKTAYRPLEPAPPLAEVWADEPRDSLFLYVHIPFCEMRCGFCNLFTRSHPPAEQVSAYLDQLELQARTVMAQLGGDARFVRMAIGGGTPTYLSAGELEVLFDIGERIVGADSPAVGLSVETSPATATPDRLRVLSERGVHRISIGVQSFVESETRAVGRPQRRARVEEALSTIRAAGIPVLNVDLIYGIEGQTLETWQDSLDGALAWRPEELYLYPLYLRPMTGIGRRGHTADDWDRQRLAMYRHAVDLLDAAGYVQQSMRGFRRGDVPADPGSEYCCQDDGMVGLGCGARSYTSALHYSFDYAVGIPHVRAVLDEYLARDVGAFARADRGFRLDGHEQRTRWLIKSLLRAPGLDVDAYRRRFGSSHLDDFPQLRELPARGWMTGDRLTAEGLAMSDLIGPWLMTDRVRRAMAGYEPR